MNHPFKPAPPVGRCTAGESMLESARLHELLGILGRPRFNDLIDLLIEDCRELPDRIRRCHARGDRAGMSAEAAGLSRAAASVGATQLGEAASLLSCSDLARALPLIDALDQAAHATLCVARHVFERRFDIAADG